MTEYVLNDIAEITSSKRIFYSDYVDSGIPFYRSREIINLDNGEDLKELIFISQEKYQDIKNKFGAPSKNDILITSVGTIRNTYLVREEDEFYFKDGNLTWLRRWGDNVEPKFVLYWIKSPVGQGELYSQLIGSSQKALTISALKKIKMNLPPLPTQCKIASILSAYDDLIENNLKRIKLLEEKAQLHYKELMQELSYAKTKREEYIKDCLAFYIGGGWGEEDYKEKFTQQAYVIRGTDIPGTRGGNISGTGRGNGIAPVTSPTPPYVRFSAYGG
jgi:type I restriction enzyme S subunit